MNEEQEVKKVRNGSRRLNETREYEKKKKGRKSRK